MKKCIKPFLSGGLLLAAIAGSAQLVHAESIGEVVSQQKELSNLDHQIDRNERLLELQKQQLEMTELKRPQPLRPRQRAQGNTQVEYFGQRTPQGANNQGRGEPSPSIKKPEKSDAEKRRERVLAVLDDAVLNEAYIAKDNPNGGFVGVISMSGRSLEVRKGSTIEGWKAISVELDRVVFENKEFQVRKTVFQAR